MRRDYVPFDVFKENFIDHPDGFFPVYSSLEENDDEDDDREYNKVVELDMICEWRLPDAKIKFIAVPFETDEQFNEIMAYLHVTAGLIHEAITKHHQETQKLFQEQEWEE